MKYLPYIPAMLIIVAFCVTTNMGYCQISQPVKLNDEKPITVVNYQDIQFGTFSQGPGGGTITITPQGERQVTGSVVPLNFNSTFFPLIFEVEAPEGSVISIADTGPILLHGSNGGTMTLMIGDAFPGKTFVSNSSPPGRTQVRLGATLTVGSPATSPPGKYSGNINITFILE